MVNICPSRSCQTNRHERVKVESAGDQDLEAVVARLGRGLDPVRAAGECYFGYSLGTSLFRSRLSCRALPLCFVACRIGVSKCAVRRVAVTLCVGRFRSSSSPCRPSGAWAMYWANWPSSHRTSWLKGAARTLKASERLYEDEVPARYRYLHPSREAPATGGARALCGVLRG